jgi:hypothetical protein
MGASMYHPIVASHRLGKYIPRVTKIYWRRRFLCRPCNVKGEQKISSYQIFLSNDAPEHHESSEQKILVLLHNMSLTARHGLVQ